MEIYYGFTTLAFVLFVLFLVRRLRETKVNTDSTSAGMSANSKRLIVVSAALICAVIGLVLAIENP